MMLLPWDLEDWLTNEGDRIVHKAAAEGEGSLDARERLVYEIWLLDTEQRNGGISQYFCNNGAGQWQKLCAAASPLLTSFLPVEQGINGIVAGAEDPYLAILARGSQADEIYRKHCRELISELKAVTEHV